MGFVKFDLKKIGTLPNNEVPVGSILLGVVGELPSGWLRPNGAAVSREFYSELNDIYSVLTYPYGNGDGTTTFNLPDYSADPTAAIKVRRELLVDRIENVSINEKTLGNENDIENILNGTTTFAGVKTFSSIIAVNGSNTKGLGVVDSGYSGSGGYARFDNGLQICWNYEVVTNQAINNSYSTLYQGTRSYLFPVEFLSAPAPLSSAFKWGTSASWGTISAISTTTISVRGIDTGSRATGTNTLIGYAAIGTWK